MARNTLKGVAPAGPSTPTPELTLDTLQDAIEEAHCALLAPKSILDLLGAHDLTDKAGEAFFALERLVDAAEGKLAHVEDLVAQLRKQERQA